MAGSFIAISHHGVADAHELLARLYQRTGDLSEPLADIGEGLALSHRDRWDAQETPEGEPWAPLSDKYRASTTICATPSTIRPIPRPSTSAPRLNTAPPTSSVAPRSICPSAPIWGCRKQTSRACWRRWKAILRRTRTKPLGRLQGEGRCDGMVWPL
ncbi:hypothetical protein HNP12_000978 [Aeromonas hydrophila]|nr:hypothetical protein [Aeromonas hydrophila]